MNCPASGQIIGASRLDNCVSVTEAEIGGVIIFNFFLVDPYVERGQG